MSELKEIDREKLADLLAKVKAATKADRDIDIELMATFLPNHKRTQEIGFYDLMWVPWEWKDFRWQEAERISYTASIDASLALVERVLPGWAWGVIKEDLRGCIGYVHNNESHFVGIGSAPNPNKRWLECRAATPPLAILAALLSALPNTQGKA